jgi:hypothetical protein
MGEKVCAVLIVASLIVLAVAVDRLVQNGIRHDATALRADIATVGRSVQR